MQVIEISEPLDLQKIPNENVVLAMGFFEGSIAAIRRLFNVPRRLQRNGI